MEYFKSLPSDTDLISITNAYHILWRAGNIALSQPSVEPAIKAIQGQEITKLFTKLDTVREAATVIASALPEPEQPLITLGTLVDPLRNDINRIYAQNGAETNKDINPFIVDDERLAALMGLSLYIGAAKNSLHTSREPS